MEIILWIGMLTVAILTGFASGVEAGRTEACASVHTEWVNDKCMKVIREEVK